MVIISIWLEQNVDVCEAGLDIIRDEKLCRANVASDLSVYPPPAFRIFWPFPQFYNLSKPPFPSLETGAQKDKTIWKNTSFNEYTRASGKSIIFRSFKYGIHREGCWWWYKTNRKVVVGIIGHSGRPTIPPPPPTQSQPPCPLNHPPPRSKTENTASFFAGNPSHQNSFILTRISAKKKLF